MTLENIHASMWTDRVLNPAPLIPKSGALPIALRGPVLYRWKTQFTPFSTIFKPYTGGWGVIAKGYAMEPRLRYKTSAL